MSDPTGQPRRDGPLVEAEDNEADPFALDDFLSEAQNKGKPLDGIGAGSGMAASTGGSMSVSISSRKRNEPMPETTTMAPPSEQPATDPPAATTLDPAIDPPAATLMDEEAEMQAAHALSLGGAATTLDPATDPTTASTPNPATGPPAAATRDPAPPATPADSPVHPNRAPECPVCLGELEGEAAAEAVTLRCGHTVHVECWLPIVLMVGAGDTAQRRHIEDRMGRKCPVCRTDFSEGVSQMLRKRRNILRRAENEDARDETLETILRSMRPDHPLLPENTGDKRGGEDEGVDPLHSSMGLGPEHVRQLLRQESVVPEAQRVLTRLLRAELQAAPHS